MQFGIHQDCNHYMPPHMEDMLIGRASICWTCGEKFPLDDESMKDDMPSCFGCRNKELITESDFGNKFELAEFINSKLTNSK